MTLETISLLAGIGAALLTSVSVVGGFFWGISHRIAADFERRDAEIERVEREARLAVAAADAHCKMLIETLSRELTDYKIDAERHFATQDGVEKALEPVLKALEKLGDRIDRLITEGIPIRPSDPRPR